MIDLLTLVAVIILFVAYVLFVIFLPVVIGGITDDERWLWGLIITLPLGMALMVMGIICWGWADWVNIECLSNN